LNQSFEKPYNSNFLEYSAAATMAIKRKCIVSHENQMSPSLYSVWAALRTGCRQNMTTGLTLDFGLGFDHNVNAETHSNLIGRSSSEKWYITT
jgi:hypothetical protein